MGLRLIGRQRNGTAVKTLAGVALVVVMQVAGAALSPAWAQFSFFGPSEASPQDVYDTISSHGFRLVGPLFRNGRVYVADVLDRRQRRERLVIAAESGQIVQRYFVDVSAPNRPRAFSSQASVDRRPTREGDDSFFSRLTRGWDDEPPPRPPLGLDRPENDDAPRATQVPVAPRSHPRPEPRVVTRTDVAPVTASPLPPSGPPVQTRKPDVGAPVTAVPAPTGATSGRPTTVTVDPLRIPDARKGESTKVPEPPKSPPATVAATKPAEPAPVKPAETKPKPAGDVPVAPLD